jgi:hypothetical protein
MMRCVILCAVAVTSAAALGAGPGEPSTTAGTGAAGVSPAATLSRALDAYDAGAGALAAHQETAQASFKESAALLQSLADGAAGGQPIRNAALYYNMGNAYFLAGDTGRAVLNYRRAASLAPLNIEIKKNFVAAREKVGAGSVQSEAGAVATALLYIESIPARTRFIVFATALGAVFFILLWRLTGARLRPARWIAATVAIVAACAMATLVVPMAMRGNDAAVVVTPQVVGRSGPDDVMYEADPSTPIKGGTEVSLIQQQGGWALVELPGQKRTWLPESAVELVNPQPQ